ncbi:restriction endonuclease subunit S [uncultured Sphingobacterium sp.]|uniref:restriction endonuclease subunit S n=1 Tax=uncultured Sphingobacterium sp. TaxID=182688 RepID=UPI0025D39F96|nr:restriction endonuclease subunit S [uncultured Sphingobacterium sp.]
MNKLPDHWKSLPLRELVHTKKGRKPIKLTAVKFKDSVPYLDIDAIENFNFKQYADKYSTVIATQNDILIVADGSRSGLVARGIDGAVGSTIICITPFTIDYDYLFYFLKSKFVYLNNNTTGASIPHLNQKLLLDLNVPIPPINEQVSISAFLKKQLEKYREDFKGTELELLEITKLKRSVLEKAFSGILTEGWRRKNNYLKTNTISQLLELNPSANLVKTENSRFKIPENWVITDAQSICKKITDGEHSTPPRQKFGELLLSARNVRDGFIDYSNVDFISNESLKKLRERCNPEKNDVLIVSVGATIGRTSVIKDDILFALVRSVLLLKPVISGEYLMFCIQSPILQDIIKESSKGVAQAHLYINETKILPIPFPSLKEQNEIVKKIKEHFQAAELIEETTISALKKIEELEKAILQIAFSGNLLEIRESKSEVNEKWFVNFCSDVAIERKKYKIEILDRSSASKALAKKFREKMAVKKSIIEIIESSPENSILVEDAWQQSQHFEKGDIELFYEELELASKKNKSGKTVTWNFVDNSNNVILKFK